MVPVARVIPHDPWNCETPPLDAAEEPDVTERRPEEADADVAGADVDAVRISNRSRAFPS